MISVIQIISEPVSVELLSSRQSRRIIPKSVFWRGRLYPVTKLGLHHSYRQGRVLFHIFSVVSKSLFLRLKLNTETLFWEIIEISDGLSA